MFNLDFQARSELNQYELKLYLIVQRSTVGKWNPQAHLSLDNLLMGQSAVCAGDHADDHG